MKAGADNENSGNARHSAERACDLLVERTYSLSRQPNVPLFGRIA